VVIGLIVNQQLFVETPLACRTDQYNGGHHMHGSFA
jgi:hypothetical protein